MMRQEGWDMWYDRIEKDSLGGWVFVIAGLVALCLFIPSFTALLGLALLASVILTAMIVGFAFLFSMFETVAMRMSRTQESTGMPTMDAMS
jgi:hypothetical protein